MGVSLGWSGTLRCIRWISLKTWEPSRNRSSQSGRWWARLWGIKECWGCIRDGVSPLINLFPLSFIFWSVPTMMSIGPFTSCKWTAMEILKKTYKKFYLKKEDAQLSFMENFLLGGCSGCIAVCAPLFHYSFSLFIF